MSKKICIFVFFVTCVWTLVYIPGAYSSANCPLVRLTNGYTKYSGMGRIVRFYCYRPHILVGATSAICRHREWDQPPPFCASTSCPSLGRILHGTVSLSASGAVATSTCDPGFSVIGSASILCTEKGWNDSLPVCQADSLLQFGTCHFEPHEAQQCNWILKPALFKWTLMSSDRHDPSDIGNYPGFDHTLGPHPGGHYLYLKNAMTVSSISLRLEQRPDNGAKYISPLFPAVEGTDEWCLIFFIYSFGPNAGNVKVTINNDTVWENNELLRRNMWTKVTITLVHQRDPFRIIIIGKGNLGQSSNTAIDDLRIAHGADCLDNSDRVLPYSVEPGFEETTTETTTVTNSASSHDINKRETTTEASESTSEASTTEIISSSNSPSTEFTTTVRNISTGTSTQSNTKVDFSTSTSTEHSQNSEISTSDAPSSRTQRTSTSTNFTSSPSTASDVTHSPATSTNESEISSTSAEISQSVSENENKETVLLSTSSYNYQSTDSLNIIDTSTYNSTFITETDDISMPVKFENVKGWSDLEKSMIYLSIVVVSTIVLIATLIGIRYRRYHTIRMNTKNVSYHNENIAFLNGVELSEKY